MRAASSRIGEDELVVLGVVLRFDRRRQRLRVDGVPEREVVLLDGHDVREVAADLEPEREGDRLHPLVAEHDPLLHPLADEAPADDRERVLRQPAGERVAQVERRGEVLDLGGGEQQRPLPLIVSRSTERKRVSCAKNPLVSSPTSPRSSQMQKVEPSRIVRVT